VCHKQQQGKFEYGMCAMTAKPRGRALGLPFEGTTGPLNAITDVAGVQVGAVTLITGDGALVRGQGPVRTGVTAILPRGKSQAHIPCAAGSYALNGNGEMTGLAWIEESGELQTPITLTFDGDLNDINGFHVTAEHTLEALDKAQGGPVEMGSVGGGTGMVCYDFKAGNGSASRVIELDGERFTLGVFVQANFGRREHFTILGAPVGRHITHDKLRGREQGSVIAIVATDAPLMAHQLKRLARRVPLGLARTGTVANNSSGDIFLAFSTANAPAFEAGGKGARTLQSLPNDAIDPLFAAVVEATEEAVIDSMLAAETMVGRDGNRAIALPVDDMLAVMKRFGRMA
jgi:L-aminopeptidase/D-esterase-like protein